MTDPSLPVFPFTTALLSWFEGHLRPMPWKGVKDPYRIWLSEIILQQTRVAQGLPYYERFVEHFPHVADLAAAEPDTVLKLWEGLGYYTRARNLHDTARHITYDLDGRFPESYAGLLALKGIGPYTAAAIASFAYDLPHAVLDGNVFRVLARVFGLDMPIDSTAGKKRFAQLAQDLLDPHQPGTYNQAIMDFGATVCTPQDPACPACPMRTFCQARIQNRVEVLPVKAKKLQKRDRFFNYLVFRFADKTLIKQRREKDIWQGLYDFPLIEYSQLIDTLEDLQADPAWPGWKPTYIRRSKPFRQTLSHQHIHALFWEIELPTKPDVFYTDWQVVDWKNLSKFAFPKIIDCYFNDNSLYLELL